MADWDEEDIVAPQRAGDGGARAADADPARDGAEDLSSLVVKKRANRPSALLEFAEVKAPGTGLRALLEGDVMRGVKASGRPAHDLEALLRRYQIWQQRMAPRMTLGETFEAFGKSTARMKKTDVHDLVIEMREEVFRKRFTEVESNAAKKSRLGKAEADEDGDEQMPEAEDPPREAALSPPPPRAAKLGTSSAPEDGATQVVAEDWTQPSTPAGGGGEATQLVSEEWTQQESEPVAAARGESEPAADAAPQASQEWKRAGVRRSKVLDSDSDSDSD